MYEKCFNMTSTERCKIDNEVSCIVQVECKTKYSVTIPQNMLKNVFDISIKQEENFRKRFSKKYLMQK